MVCRLKSLCSAASRLELKVNMNKSNILVFRKGGYLASRERWFYDSAEMKLVNSYKYLGIFFTTKILSFRYACEDLVSRRKKAVVDIMKQIV